MPSLYTLTAYEYFRVDVVVLHSRRRGVIFALEKGRNEIATCDTISVEEHSRLTTFIFLRAAFPLHQPF